MEQQGSEQNISPELLGSRGPLMPSEQSEQFELRFTRLELNMLQRALESSPYEEVQAVRDRIIRALLGEGGRTRCVPHGEDLVKVTGPAVVRSPAGECEITTDITLKFPVESEVWIKVWGDGV